METQGLQEIDGRERLAHHRRVSAKGSVRGTILAAVLAVVFAFPAGWFVAMMSTPLLWKLEPVLHMELAGHSGPSDWVFFVVWGILVVALFLLFRWIGRKRDLKA